MTVDIVSVICGPSRPELPNCTPLLFDNNDNAKTPCQCYQEILEASTADVIVYAHSDLDIHEESWMESITAPFRMPDCVAVGLGGATLLGRPNLYKQPYRIENMARGGYCSNQGDWEVHGGHEQGVKRIAVPEAFFMAVRREWLLEIGGWPVDHITHHGIDMWLACEAARHGKGIWMVGVSCLHRGGGVSVSDKYRSAKWLQGQSMESDHQTPHLWLYNEYREVLPIIYADERRPVRDPSAVTGGSVAVDAAAPLTYETQNQEEVHEEKRQEAKVTTRGGGKCNVVMVTNGKRPRLLDQALCTLYGNTPQDEFSLVVVFEGDQDIQRGEIATYVTSRIAQSSILSIDSPCRVLSRLKNLGVYWSEKQFGRGEWLCIVDDDVAFFPGWLEKMIYVTSNFGPGLLGGVRHPYHGVNEDVCSPVSVMRLDCTDAVAGYCHFMRWETLDQFGPYEGNAEGIGQSEDFAFSRKIVDAGYRVGYIHPPVMAHCGITNSLGQPAIGAELFERVPGVIYE